MTSLFRLLRWEQIGRWFFPSRCGVCHAFCDGAICARCQDQWVPLTPPYCRWCGKPFDQQARTSPLCGLCLQGRFRFDGARSAVRYEGVGREAVHALKFHRKPRLAQPMGEWMAVVLQRAREGDDGLLPEGWLTPDWLIPVPLHPATYRRRGYNQATLLAQTVSERTGIPVLDDLVVQVRRTKPQATLGERERWENVKGAFEVTTPEAIKGRVVVVVDDVMTTGATVNEIARLLKRDGARLVYCLTFARSISL